MSGSKRVNTLPFVSLNIRQSEQYLKMYICFGPWLSIKYHCSHLMWKKHLWVSKGTVCKEFKIMNYIVGLRLMLWCSHHMWNKCTGYVSLRHAIISKFEDFQHFPMSYLHFYRFLHQNYANKIMIRTICSLLTVTFIIHQS